ncbi:MAG: molecular chaperone TorD family protein [Lachnospiraceae bacterium]|nr:molecular chaperone TorD family protein [Lachnospiraceae bacterium]
MTVEQAINLSDFYQLMAIAMRCPTKELAEGLLDGSFADDMAACMEGLGVSADVADEAYDTLCAAVLADASQAEELFHLLRVEYTRLFLIPKKEKIYIYESRFCYPKDADPRQYSMFVSPCALHAEQCYKEAGVRVRKDLQEVPDHMATELEYISYLYRKMAETITMENKTEQVLWKVRIETFWQKHLNKWYDAFLAEIQEKTESETYKALATLGGMRFDVPGSGR